ncbi:MAG: flavodoxin family protein [Patescibacteria group bacterium]
MNVLVISGSRNPAGQTARAAGALAKGIEAAGAGVETVFLPAINIERCRQCRDDGWGVCIDEGRCIQDDDFGPLVERLKKADAAVFATPVYWGDLSESLRAFLDRLRRTCMHEAGKRGIKGKIALGVCVAGGGGGGAPSCTTSLQGVLSTCGFDVVDVIPARRQNLEMKLEILETAGAWLAGKRERS